MHSYKPAEQNENSAKNARRLSVWNANWKDGRPCALRGEVSLDAQGICLLPLAILGVGGEAVLLGKRSSRGNLVTLRGSYNLFC